MSRKMGKRRTWRCGEMAGEAREAAQEKKAFEIVALDMRTVSSVADVFFICSAANERQVEAVVHNIEERLKKADFMALRMEGLPEARWVVMDYGDVLIHVFLEEARRYYSLETLWGDAPRIFPSENSG